jgi:hypothetical protein
MRIDTLKTRNRLINEYGVDERQAEGIVEAIASAEDQVATKADLRRWALRIVLANLTGTGVLLALFAFVS